MTFVEPGAEIGRWSVLDNYRLNARGEKQWLCRCDCGTERYVLERSLKYGGSLSCGCLRTESLSDALSYDIAGCIFGELTVIERSELYHRNGGVWWKCRCSCGNICEAPASVLVTGRKLDCGSKSHEKNYRYSDISGQRFGKLTAQYPTDKRDLKGSVIWHCACDCGVETDVAYNALMYANQQSCGCLKEAHNKRLGQLQSRADGTSLDKIKSTKLPSDNTTGYKGVYFIRGKYVAKIVFQKKAYYLGTFDNIEDAYQARLEAEENLYRPTLEYHTAWQKKAEKDPQWAVENPMKIFVTKNNEHLDVHFLPKLEA